MNKDNFFRRDRIFLSDAIIATQEIIDAYCLIERSRSNIRVLEVVADFVKRQRCDDEQFHGGQRGKIIQGIYTRISYYLEDYLEEVKEYTNNLIDKTANDFWHHNSESEKKRLTEAAVKRQFDLLKSIRGLSATSDEQLQILASNIIKQCFVYFDPDQYKFDFCTDF